MALASTTIIEVETAGSDTLNGGAFDPGQTAGMFTDGAATVATSAAPVFTSASYNFVAGDVNAWLFIASGTNWTPGWYKIASVAANAATLSAASGAAVITPTSNASSLAVMTPSTAGGCATTASPTAATWSIDYSQQAAAQFAYTDLVSAGTGLTVSSVLKPFAKQHVGNSLVITGGTNFNLGRYVIASISGVTATVVGPGSITTGVGANGTGGQGGAVVSVAIASSFLVASVRIYIQTGNYTISSASTNVANGCCTRSVNGVTIEGYSAVRGDLIPFGAAGTRPVLTASGISTFTIFGGTGTSGSYRNLNIIGGSFVSSRGFLILGDIVYNCRASGFTNNAFINTGGNTAFYMRCNGVSSTTQPAFSMASAAILDACVGNGNSGVPTFSASGSAVSMVNCITYSSGGVLAHGFDVSGGCVVCINCVAYNQTGMGFRAGNTAVTFVNCIAEGCTGVGFGQTGNPILVALFNCAAFNNSADKTLTGQTRLIVQGFVSGSASFFTNAGSFDFSLNNNAGGGAAARAAGYPGVLPTGLTTGFLDIGAAQHADPAASGAQGFFIQ